MTHLLDTNAWVAYLRAKNPSLTARIEAAGQNDLCLCSVVRFELFYGAFLSGRISENLTRLNKLFTRFPGHDLDEMTAREAARLRTFLESKGTPIGPYDLLIAATALAADLTLVTRNIREFGRVPNLRIENWESP